ncbi:MAG: acylphosphatase [Flavobacteriaceae bacterium]|nr:acylphosphatase [Flavobacteriaceae bacterium]
MDKINYSIMVTGKVQDVWFRKYTKDKADELGITGYVQNEFDRTVFISAEGTEKSLDKFIDWLYEGSPLSRVREVIYDNCIDFQGYIEFEIRKDA